MKFIDCDAYSSIANSQIKELNKELFKIPYRGYIVETKNHRFILVCILEGVTTHITAGYKWNQVIKNIQVLIHSCPDLSRFTDD